ncbi:MAG: hypothetical protein RLZZ494_2006 [Pseudomonadota bacterium]|jgi:hypothetical protein
MNPVFSSEHDKHLPRALYAVLALLCGALGLWASVITLRYFKHGAVILEADASAQVLALAAATMFVFAEMGAFALFSVLPVHRAAALRWKLITFVVAVLALEVVTVVAVQMAMTKSADMTQHSAAQRAQDLRRQIEQAETEATALRNQAGQLANAEHSWVKAGAPKVAAMAASASAKTGALYEELAKVDSVQRPSLIGLFGEDWAMAYAIARGVLVSCAGLVFWGAVGALWRMFSAGEAGQPQQFVQQFTPAAQQPAQAPAVGQVQQSATVATLPAPSWKPWTWGAALPLALGAVAGVPNAQAAQAPTVAQVPAAKPDPDAAKPKPEAEAKPKRSPVRDVLATGQKVDTGTGERDGSRYRRVLDAVKAGSLRPSIPAIQKAEGGSYRTITGYLEAMASEGVIQKHPSGRGWVLVQH